MEINSVSGSQGLSSNDFLRQRQIARDQYFNPEKYQSQNNTSGAVSANTTQEASALNSAEDTFVSSAPEGTANTNATATTGSATAQNTATGTGAETAQDNLSPLQRQYGSFYTTSPNGETLAELRARSDEIIARAQQREQAAMNSATSGQELGGVTG